MNSLGIYFGPQLISVVETKGNKPVNFFQFSQAEVSGVELLEEKVPLSVKISALLKDELIKNNIEATDAIVSISGKDLIVRTFEMPILPHQELITAVNFEVKKYIPFRTEDLISDFQYKVDKGIQKTRVLFVGIKKEALDNYLSILSQSGIKVRSVEYSAFSILRLLKVANIKDKGIMGVVNIDLVRDDEANFVVLENGFPLFSRDISLMSGHEELVKPEENQRGVILEKLKREIQISLDYYDRKFPGKNISKMFFVTNPDYREDLDGFVKELGLGNNFIDINKYIDRPVPFSLPFVKGYCSSLSRIDTAIKINLLLAKERVTKKEGEAQAAPPSALRRFKTDIIVSVMCLSALVAVLLLSIYRALPLQQELRNIINTRPAASGVSAGLGYKELQDASANFKLKADALESVAKGKIYITPLLDALPRLIPKGLRFAGFSFKREEGRLELILEGAISLGNSDKELDLVKSFLSVLKENPVFTRYFDDISILSTGHKETDKTGLTNFVISCQGPIILGKGKK